MSNATIRKKQNKSSGGLAANPNGKAKSSPKPRAVNRKKASGPREQKVDTVPVALSLTAYKSDPKIRADGKTCRISHSELVGNLTTPNLDFNSFNIIRRFRLNPGSSTLFNWLSNTAVNYESYKFHKLKLHYLTRASTGTTGSVMISADYDAADGAAQTNEQSLFNNAGSVDCSVWKNITWTANTASMNRLYKSHTCMSDLRFETTKQDQKTIDVGQLFVAAEASVGNTGLGKLIVEYDVEFFDPQVPTENPSTGGLRYFSTTIAGNSKKPFSDRPDRIEWQPGSEKILETGPPFSQITAPVGVFQANLGQFLRDYEGIINTSLKGTGVTVSSAPNYYVRDLADWHINAGDALSDVLQTPLVNGTVDVVNGPGTGTDLRTTRFVKALKGQLLAMETRPATTLGDMQIDFAGMSSQVANVLQQLL
jgi:hypothetical protein